MPAMNRQVLLASRPQGAVIEDNFRIVDAPMPAPGDGEVLIKNEWLSLDPYMRGRMSDAKSYVPPAAIGEVMVGQTVGSVVASRDPAWKPGDKVLASVGWQLYGVARARDLTAIDVTRAPASCYLGVLGMPGMTAWFGLREIGRPKPGDTVCVSAASGAVGSVVGQLAKLEGCRAVGIAGGPRSARTSSTSSASTPASITRQATSRRTCATRAPTAWTSSSRMSAGWCSTPRLG